ncbi:MAG: hypothetical protein IPG51_19130 [Chloroflexi bacterium]|nr:hypothetical protein [Chloroflexota bacterium]
MPSTGCCWERGRARFPSPYSPLTTAVIVLLMAALVSLPLFLTLRADPTLQQRVDQLAGPLAALRQGDLKPVLQSTLQTMGVFSFTGDPRWTYSWPGRPLFDWVTAVLFYAGLGVAFLRLETAELRLCPYLAGRRPASQRPHAASAQHRAPGWGHAGGLCAARPCRRSCRLARKRPSPLFARVLLPGVLTAVLLLNIALTIRDGFIRWPQAYETRLDHYQSVLLDISRHVKTNPAAALVLADSFYEPIDRDTFRRDLGQNPAARWVQTGAQVSGAVVLPQREAGENGRFYVPEFAPVNPILLAAAGIAAEPVYRSDGYPSFAVYELPRERPCRPCLFLYYSRVIDLVGYTIRPSEAAEPLQLVTVWRVCSRCPPI